ncbi:Cyclase-like protein 1 [Linum grandiflorum]
MAKQQVLAPSQFLLLIILLVGALFMGSDADGDLTPCSKTPVPPAQEQEVYANGRIIDITHRVTPEMPKYGAETGVGTIYTLTESLEDGYLANVGEFNDLGTHTGTHVDTPGHFCEDLFEAGYTVGTLNLETLNGPALVVEVPRDSNITAEVMKSLKIPRGTRRVLFRTLNTDKQLMKKTEFDSTYTGFKTSGAKWLVENTDIKLVGIDYLSVSIVDDAAPVHREFLKGIDIIVVEGMNLDNVEAGVYDVHCLPLRVIGADGTPSRCIAIKPELKTAIV